MFNLGLSFGQSPQQPYAAIDRNAVSYNGPGRDAAHDVAGPEIRLGLLLPLSGPREAEGLAFKRAAELAIEEANDAPAVPGPRLKFVARDEAGPWGQAATQIAHLVFDDDALAVITSAEGDSAHLAVQIGNKIGVPVLTLASDSTTTETNLPWIFRMVPGDEEQAQAFAQDIYQKRHLRRVVLLTEREHDGRLGGEAFIRAAGDLHAPPPHQVVIDPGKAGESSIAKELAAAQAIVIWTDAATAKLLTARLRDMQPATPIYLCRKAAANEAIPAGRAALSGITGHQEEWIAAARPNLRARAEFAKHYRERFGADPETGASETYDAVRILAASLRRSGPNRARLRDELAGVSSFAGASGIISFDHAGNDTSPIVLVKLP